MPSGIIWTLVIFLIIWVPIAFMVFRRPSPARPSTVMRMAYGMPGPTIEPSDRPVLSTGAVVMSPNVRFRRTVYDSRHDRLPLNKRDGREAYGTAHLINCTEEDVIELAPVINVPPRQLRPADKRWLGVELEISELWIPVQIYEIDLANYEELKPLLPASSLESRALWVRLHSFYGGQSLHVRDDLGNLIDMSYKPQFNIQELLAQP